MVRRRCCTTLVALPHKHRRDIAFPFGYHASDETLEHLTEECDMKRLDAGHPSRRYLSLAITLVVLGVGAGATASSYTYDMNGFDALTGFITTSATTAR
jgi:hypothetical protein